MTCTVSLARRRMTGAAMVLLLAVGAPVIADASNPTPRAIAGRGWLGIAMETAAHDAGVRVRHVVRGSPAEKAGIKDGDAITALDGARVSAAEEVTRIVSGRAPGDEVIATVVRASKVMTLKIALGDRPTSDEVLRMDRVGEFAPAWVGVEPVGGAPRTIASLRGRVVLLDFWATWCGACRVLAPTLSGWQAKYGAQGLSVVGITTEAADEAALFAERTGMKYGVAVDAKGETSRAYSVAALPTLFVIDKRGVVRDVTIGYDQAREAQVESLVKKLLEEPAP